MLVRVVGGVLFMMVMVNGMVFGEIDSCCQCLIDLFGLGFVCLIVIDVMGVVDIVVI